MACERTPELMLLLDGELSPFEARALEAHAASCEVCARERARFAALAAAVAREAPPVAAPAALRRRIERSLDPAPPARSRRPWLSLAASLVLGAVLGGGATWQLVAPGDGDVDAAVAVHMRALMANHLTDVASSDQHAVRPWFAGKVPLSPPSPNLDAEGFILVGGRVDEIDGKPAAAVVYRRRQHMIDLIVAPMPEGATPHHLVRRGYNVVAWSADGLAYWAVSDLNQDELQEFATLIRDAR